MAVKLKSKKKKNEESVKIIDYYKMYGLNRNSSSDEILALLNSMLNKGCQMLQSARGEELIKKINAQNDELKRAISKFRNKDLKREYDKELDYAIKNNLVDEELQVVAANIWEELERLLVMENYAEVIKKCNDLLLTSVDLRVYDYLSKSYYLTDNVDKALSTVDKCVDVHPDDIFALRMAARAYNDFANNFDQSQKYVNQINEIAPDSSIGVNEQSYIYLCMGNKEMAFSIIDKYIKENPSDEYFRKECANDIINYSHRSFVLMDVEGKPVRVIADQGEYENCLSLAQKAYDICGEGFVSEYFKVVSSYGETEFNIDNAEYIKWMKISTVFYALITIGEIGLLIGIGAVWIAVLGGLALGGLTALMAYCTMQLIAVSNRPYWQIYKYYLTGKREKREKIFIFIGKLNTWYLKSSIKFTKVFFKFAIKISLPS